MEPSSESSRAKLVKGTACSFMATVLAKLAFLVNSLFVALLFGNFGLEMSGNARTAVREPDWLALSGNDMEHIWEMAGGVE